nr:unnamed protein product [Spirometra erinaceieuropaei]
MMTGWFQNNITFLCITRPLKVAKLLSPAASLLFNSLPIRGVSDVPLENSPVEKNFLVKVSEAAFPGQKGRGRTVSDCSLAFFPILKAARMVIFSFELSISFISAKLKKRSDRDFLSVSQQNSMEVDETILPTTDEISQGTVSVLLHPIVVLSISEHWMREKLARDSSSPQVFGALLGKQNGRTVESKQIFSDLDLVGWYTTGRSINEEDKLFHYQMQEITEALLIVKLDPLDKLGEQLPVRVYESVVDNDARFLFKRVPYTLAQGEAERIGVDHIARVSGCTSSKETSLTAEYLMSNVQAVQMLSRRLHLLKAYVASVIKGELPPNWPRLREISALLRRLPLVLSSLQQQQQHQPDALSPNESVGAGSSTDKFLCQANDVCLTALLGSLTQSMQTLYTWLSQSTQAASRRSDGGPYASSRGLSADRMNMGCAAGGAGELVYILAAGEDNV